MEFFDRVEETARLNRMFDSPKGALACVYGRRRCGKTRLLREVIRGRVNAVYFLADRSAAQLQRDRLRHELARSITIFSSIDTPTDWGRLLDVWLELTPKGSILVLDEFPYLVEQDPELPSVLQRIVDSFADSGKKIVICGSSQRMMQGLVLSASEPLYGRAQELLPINPLSFDWIDRAFPGRSSLEQLKYWAVFGGVPRYWELAAEDGDLMTALRRHVFNPMGVLYDEPRHLIVDEVSDFAKASSVLALIGNGINRMSEIAARMGRKATEMSHPIKRLLDLGLIEREVPFGADMINGKKSLYRVADNFLSFWYAFVLPNSSRPEFLETVEGMAEFERDFRGYLGQIWERLVRTRVAMDWNRVARWWGTGVNRQPMKLDVVAESRDGKSLLVGECKLSIKGNEQDRLRSELLLKAHNLPFCNRYEKIVAQVFECERLKEEFESLKV